MKCSVKYSVSLICLVLSALSLSACGTFLDRTESQINVNMREDNGVVAGLPVPPSVSNNIYRGIDSSVDVFGLDGETPVASASFYNDMTLNDGGVVTNDSSVTVYPIEGGVLEQSYNSYAPYNAPSIGESGGQNYAPNYGGASDNQIFFTHGSSRLGSGDIAKLAHVADKARFAPVSRITVEGFASQPTQAGTQSVESSILNLKESMNRSFAVSRNLMQQGVPAEKLKTVSWGDAKASGNETQDRRVDITMGER